MPSCVNPQSLGFSCREENALDAIEGATNEMRETAEPWQYCLTVERHTIAENYAEGGPSLICDLNILEPDPRVERADAKATAAYRFPRRCLFIQNPLLANRALPTRRFSHLAGQFCIGQSLP